MGRYDIESTVTGDTPQYKDNIYAKYGVTGNSGDVSATNVPTAQTTPSITVDPNKTPDDIFKRDGDLTKSEANIIGSGIQVGTAVAGGIMQGVQTKRAREAAVGESMAEIAEARVQRARQMEQANKERGLQKEQAMFENLKANTGLRLSMFERDLQKQQQSFEDTQKAISRIKSSPIGTEQLQSMMKANLIGGR